MAKDEEHFGKPKPKRHGWFEGSRNVDPDGVAMVDDITGHCDGCGHDGSARFVAYNSGEILIRCNHCKRVNMFHPDNRAYLDPNKFKPFRTDDADYNNKKLR